MHKGIKITILLLLFSAFSIVFAQSNESAFTNTFEKANDEIIFRPYIGLGVGTFSFYGDLYKKHFQPPMVSRIAYDLTVSQNLSDYIQFNFYALFGPLSANERYVNNRNVNFESQIRVGGFNFLYNFKNFLPKKRYASPYISLGFEGLEFLSKTDYYDASGNQYYYWTDGTTRNIDQNASEANTAIEIKRDYTYESDIRELNLDGFGKYQERSWAVPVGAGAIFNINDYWNFKFGATMHFTFTDYIDGITDKSLGNRVGNKNNDKFIMTSFSLSYNFGIKEKDKKFKKETYEDVDFFALDSMDLDKDGVVDLNDSCQGTPIGVIVDAKGCPLDDDFDNIPDYKDDELDTPLNSIVDTRGVQLNDSTIAYQYEFYMDSTGAFAEVVKYDHKGNQIYNTLYKKEYTVEIGRFNNGISPELMTKYLSIGDVSSANINDSTTIYTAGKYNTLIDADQRKNLLVNEGLIDAKVVYKQNGKFYDAPTTLASAKDETKTITSDKATPIDITKSSDPLESIDNVPSTIDSKGAVLRVQLGAYRNRLSKNVIFKDIPDLIEIKTEDGLYKYMTGSFTSIDEAVSHKTELLLRGYQGAFITAYKNGKRVPLKDAGATNQKKEMIVEVSDTTEVNTINKKLVSFKVQVGIFKNDVPGDIEAKMKKIKGLEKETTPAGLTRYTLGSFNDYASAIKAKDNLVKNIGIEDAFILAYFNGEYISVQEALQLLKN